MKRQSHLNCGLKRLACLMTILLAGMPACFSQSTTASISGTVRDVYGQIIEAANIQLTNNSTGIQYGTISSGVGYYSLSGLKPGEYTLRCTFIGYLVSEYIGIKLSASHDYVLNIELDEAPAELIPQVDVIAKRTGFEKKGTGSTYNIDNEALRLMPSVSRSLLDFTRLSPYSGADNSMAGRDGRTTTLTIDGALLNNSFGLSADLPGAGTPVSIDAVQEAQVVIAPFDVRQSDFTGGGINVITKSGSNTLKATAYSYFTNERMRGNSVDGYDLGTRSSQHSLTTGLTLGGPIVKDRLFYFVNAEYTTTPGPITEWRLSEDGSAKASAMISRVRQADMERFSTALGKYDYDPGSSNLSDGNQTNTKVLARLDWEISYRHSLMLRYNWTGNTQWSEPNAKSTVGAKAASNRISQNAYAFRNNCYKINDVAWSGVLELNSHFSNNMSNHLLVTVSDVSNLRDSDSDWFPHIDIRKDGDAFMSAGYELFSNGTGNYVRTYSARDYIRLTRRHSTFTAGLSYQYQKAATNYRMYGTGYYRYASLDDFIEQKAPLAFGMTYAYDGVDDPASRTSFGQSAAFLQGESQLGRLILTYGIRADLMQYYEKLETNQTYKNIDWTLHFKALGSETSDYRSPDIDTGRWPKSGIQWSPRVGFNWDIDRHSHFILRGGAGLFTGRIPLVFLTCVPNSSGMLQNTVMFSRPGDNPNVANAFLDGMAGNFMYTEQALRNYLQQNGCLMTANPNPPLNGTSITGIASDFKLPQVMKVALATDINLRLPFPASITLEAIYNKDINAVYIENWNQIHPDCMGTFRGHDERLDYHDETNINSGISKTGGAMVISNTNMGYSTSAGVTLNTEPFRNFKIQLSYTHMNAMSVSDMVGSSLSSTWGNVPIVDSANKKKLRSSAYVIPDNLKAAVTYRFSYPGNKFMSTELGVFYTGHAAGKYSYMFTNDMNGDGLTNDLIWIPSSMYDLRFDDIKDELGNVKYTAEQQQEAMWQFVCHDSYLKQRLGGYAEANAALMPWVNRFDIHLAQTFNIARLYGSKHSNESLQLSVDLMNAGNLLNDKWGVTRTPSACNDGKILTYVRSDNGVPVYNLYYNSEGLVSKTFDTLKSNANCWYLQVGLKLIFD